MVLFKLRILNFLERRKYKITNYIRKIWFISEGLLIVEGDFISTEIEREFEISPDMFESIIYASSDTQIKEDGNLNWRKKHSDQTINKMKRKGIAPKVRWKVMQRDNFKCVKCGRGVNDVDCLQVDHILPVTKNGNNDEDNLQTLCWSCNVGKFNREESKLTDFMQKQTKHSKEEINKNTQ